MVLIYHASKLSRDLQLLFF